MQQVQVRCSSHHESGGNNCFDSFFALTVGTFSAQQSQRHVPCINMMQGKVFWDGKVLKNTATTCKALTSMLMSVCAATILSACGGAPADDDMRQANGAALPKAASSKFHASSSEFNPAVWDHHNWDECDCGRNAAPIGSVPWTQFK
jgi:hypothetical protein